MKRRCHHCDASFYGVHRRRFTEACPNCGYPMRRRGARRIEREVGRRRRRGPGDRDREAQGDPPRYMSP